MSLLQHISVALHPYTLALQRSYAIPTPKSLTGAVEYRGTSPIRKRTPLRPYRRLLPRVLGGS